MVSRIVSYIQDYKFQIIETWITEVDLAPPQGSSVTRGELPVVYIEQIFDELVHVINNKPKTLNYLPKLSNYIDVTFTCDTTCPESLACLEILIAGQKAFTNILGTDWDKAGEFSDDDRTLYADLLNKTLAFVMHHEIKSCKSCKQDSNCPFNPMKLQYL